jgi:hypothetical protein
MHQSAGQAAHGSRDAKLKAAYVEAGRFCARQSERDPSASVFKIGTDNGLAFDDGGARTPLSLFHIVSFAEKLKGTKQIERYDISGSDVTIHFNTFGLHGLKSFAKAVGPSVPRKESKTLMHARLLDAFKAFEKTIEAPQAAPAAPPKQQAQQPATAASLLGPILQTLLHGARSADEVARLVSIRARVPMHKRGDAWLENGTTFDEAVRHAMIYLIGRRLLAHPTRQVGLTIQGRQYAESFESFAADGFTEPSAPQRAAPKAKLVVEPRLLSEKEMLEFWESLSQKTPRDILAIWRNAVRITTDETRVKHHEQAEVIIRMIDEEWQKRVARADLADSFRWPDATARHGSMPEREGKGGWTSDVMVGDGMLKEMGYRVGRNGLSAPVRQKMLSEIFTRTLPPVFPKPYMDQWGANESARRLHKIADCLAAFARNAARLPGNYDEAISDWQEDLEFLHDTHFAGRFGFGWPKKAEASAASLKR